MTKEIFITLCKMLEKVYARQVEIEKVLEVFFENNSSFDICEDSVRDCIVSSLPNFNKYEIDCLMEAIFDLIIKDPVIYYTTESDEKVTHYINSFEELYNFYFS